MCYSSLQDRYIDIIDVLNCFQLVDAWLRMTKMTKMVQENMFCKNSCEIGPFVCWLKFFHPRLPPPIHPQITGPSVWPRSKFDQI